MPVPHEVKVQKEVDVADPIHTYAAAHHTPNTHTDRKTSSRQRSVLWLWLCD